jgi:hypothetical protein
MTPERLNIVVPKNVAADDTLWRLNVKNRGMERGTTMTEYARG